MEKIFGHKKIIEFFDKAIVKNRLSHAYLFVGPENVGKRTVAEYIATKIFSVEKNKLKITPDYFLVEVRKNKKTDKINKDIVVDQIRELKNFLAQSSFKKGSYKIVIIDKAELLNKSASNSLLKVLEEPNKNIIFFLISKDEDLLLDTIKSRCQIINFSLVNKKNIENDFPFDLIKDYHGLVGELLKWQEDENSREKYQKEKERFLSLFGKSFYEKLVIIEDLFGEKKSDHITTRKEIIKVLNIWLIELYSLIKKKKSLDRVEAINILNIEEEINVAKKMLVKNIHPRLLLENIVLQIP